jgi:hypothetical protein
MHDSFLSSFVALAAFLTRSSDSSIGLDRHETVILQDNILPDTPIQLRDRGNSDLQIRIHNSGTEDINAYITGLDPTTGAALILQNSGSDDDGSGNYSGHEFFGPEANGSAVPVDIPVNSFAFPVSANKTASIDVPGYLSSARVWLSESDLIFKIAANAGERELSSLVEPTAINPTDAAYNLKWGFVEFTNTVGGIYVNPSYVDWVGLVVGIALTSDDKGKEIIPGLKPNAIAGICDAMKDQTATDNHPWWEEMCILDTYGNPLRILSPNIYLSIPGNENAMDGYYDAYIDQVWAKYQDEPLIISTQSDTQDEGTLVNCSITQDDVLTCPSDPSHQYDKPNVRDIMGCNSGPFAVVDPDDDVHKRIVVRLCAAFVRSTLLLDGGNVQPSMAVSNETYYQTDPTNHYARIVHEHLEGSQGYAFSYDDVNPMGENAAGVLTASSPTLLEIFIQD